MTPAMKIHCVVLIFSLIVLPLESAVCSVDLGSEWMKVAVVNLKPGQSPISIAINEMSKRKSPALVAFHGGNRLLGEEAAGIAARFPDKVFSQIRDIIGKPFEDAKKFLDSVYLPFDLVEDSRGYAGIRVDDGAIAYSAEELLAMVLSYSLHLAEFHSKASIKDAVITVPPYFGQAERKGLLQAAELAGFNVLSLVNEQCGAALQYGIDKNFANESRYVIFYDMGSSSTYAALVHFSAYNTKEYGKTVSVNQFQVKDVRWKTGLGGQNMELRLVEYFANEFNEQIGNVLDVRKSAKAIAKLKKEVKRTKEILSANIMAPISVESLYDDRDFRSSITREKFEELCADIWEQALVPLKEVLSASGLKVNDLYAVELIGGGTRVPKLQAKLQEFLGREDVDKHLDADEAVVLGAALHAANLSDGIKLNRKLGMTDGSPYGILIELDGSDLLKNENTKQLLIPRMKKIPSKMLRSIKHNKDFEVSLSYESSGELPPSASSAKFAQYSVSGLTDTNEKYASYNLSSPIKANLHFSQSRSGVISFDRAEAVVEISEWVEVPIKNLTVEHSSAAASNVSLEISPNNGKEQPSNGTEQPNSGAEQTENNTSIEEGITAASNISAEETSTTHSITEKKLKKRTFRVPLKITEKVVGPGTALSEESIIEARQKLQALDKKDAERRRAAELKNNLEGYIYSTREKLEASQEIQKISSEEESHSFIRKLDEVQDWLYMDGENAPAGEFQDHLDTLKAIGDPIFFRLSELTARPAASKYAQKYLTEIPQIVSSWDKTKSWLPKSKIDEVLWEADKLQKWLEEKEAQQNSITVFSIPAFKSEEVYNKVFDLQDKVTRVDRMPKPKPKIEKPEKREIEGEGIKTSNSNNSTFSEGGSQAERSSNDSENAPTGESHSGKEAHDEL